MKRSWLVQRLKAPRGRPNPFAFGGGYKNGGLSDNASDILASVFSFDYMGAAEFEFGAVPEALSSLGADRDSLVAWTLDIDLQIVPPDWRDESGVQPDGTKTVYVISRQEHMDEIVNRLLAFAACEADTKEPVYLNRALRPYSEYDLETLGWLELNNGYFFFVDKEMWQQTASLFEVSTESLAS